MENIILIVNIIIKKMLGNILPKQQKRIITYTVSPTQNPHPHNDPNPLTRTTNPHHPKPQQLPNNSAISHQISQHLTKTYSSQPPKTQQQMYKIMCLMREQIQISNNFYTNKMKQLLQDQAKEIGSLRELVVQNQRELIKKNAVINQLRVDRERQTPKKKMTVISSQQDIVGSSPEGYQQLMEKIQQLQQKLANLQNNITQKHEAQTLLNNRIQKIQKGTVKLLAGKIASCGSKLDKYLIKKQKQLQKIYADCLNLTRLTNQTTQITNPTQNSSSPIITTTNTKLTKLNKELSQLKQQISILKTKQYKYDNYQVEKLREQLVALKKYVKSEENGRKVDRNKESQIRYFQSQKHIVIPKQANNNMIRSQRYIEGYQQSKLSTNKNTVPYSKINLSTYSKIQPQQQPQAQLQQQLKQQPQQQQQQQTVYYSRQTQPKPQQQNTQPLLLNNSTPSLLRNYSQGGNFVQNNGSKILDRSGRLCSNTNNNSNSRCQLISNNSAQLTKTFNLSTQASRSINPKNTPSTNNSPLQNQFYQQQPNSPSSQPQSQNSECEQYTDSQQSQYEQPLELEQRLIKTIKQNNLRMPVSVEIDQTGCLKCVETGMYLVDQNNDVFYLQEWHMEVFVGRGVLREVGSVIRG